MPLGELHKQVATVALRAAAGHGFALGGSNALIAHGLIQRPTLDVDLFTDQEHGVEAAADAVEAALTAARFGVERRDKTAGLSDIFSGMGEGLAEWLITSAGGEQMALQMAYFDRCNQPVVMEFGPVLDLEDALGGKVAAPGQPLLRAGLLGHIRSAGALHARAAYRLRPSARPGTSSRGLRRCRQPT
jgi:hypothetical protein